MPSSSAPHAESGAAAAAPASAAPAPAAPPKKAKPPATASTSPAPDSSTHTNTADSRAPAPAKTPGPATTAPAAAAASAVTSAAAAGAANEPAAASRPAAPTAPALDLATLEQRLRDTRAIGLFTKLSLKNQVDDLLDQFKAFHHGQSPPTLPQLRQRYELLLLKVVTLLQDGDAPLAAAISSSREAIWQILTDPQKLARL
jgi:hypothetical protein